MFQDRRVSSSVKVVYFHSGILFVYINYCVALKHDSFLRNYNMKYVLLCEMSFLHAHYHCIIIASTTSIHDIVVSTIIIIMRLYE